MGVGGVKLVSCTVFHSKKSGVFKKEIKEKKRKEKKGRKKEIADNKNSEQTAG